jgi:hypothetical protein
MSFEPVELFIDRNEGGFDLVFSIPIGHPHRGLDAKDDLAEQIIDGRK